MPFIKQCIIAAVATAAIEEAPKLILQIIDSYTETKESQEYFEAFKTELDNKIIFTSSELGTIKSTLESSGHIENTLVKKVEAGLGVIKTALFLRSYFFPIKQQKPDIRKHIKKKCNGIAPMEKSKSKSRLFINGKEER